MAQLQRNVVFPWYINQLEIKKVEREFDSVKFDEDLRETLETKLKQLNS